MAFKEIKRQHYVPETYLRHFSKGESGKHFINVLPVESLEEDKIKKINISNLCLQNDFYTLPGDTSGERLAIENFYNMNWEKHYNKIYALLINPEKHIVTSVERELIISTVVTMLFRNAKFPNSINSFISNGLRQVYLKCKRDGNEHFIFCEEKISIKEKTLQQVLNEYETNSRPGRVLQQIKAALKCVTLRILKDGIWVSKLTDDESEFITSDNPVSCVNIGVSGRISPLDPTNTLHLPLDSKHRLSLFPYAENRTKHIVFRENLKGDIGTDQSIVNYSHQHRNAERFLLGTHSGLTKLVNMIEATNSPL